MSFFAEFMGPDGLPVEITPDVYNESTHRGHLRCPEDGCVAPMPFRKGGPVEGCTKHRRDHFASVSIGDHKDGCPTVDPKVKQYTTTIRDAFDGNGFILINLNHDLPKGTTRRPREFDERSWREYMGLSPRSSFQRSAKQATISVKDMNELHRYKKLIRAVGADKGWKDPFCNVHVSYKGAIAPWKRFALFDQGAHEALFNNLMGARTSNTPSYGFSAVRWIKIDPSRKSQKPNAILGTPYIPNPDDKNPTAIGDCVWLYKDDFGASLPRIKDILNQAGAFAVMADPELQNWQRSGTGTPARTPIDLTWKVGNVAQLWVEDRALNRELRALQPN